MGYKPTAEDRLKGLESSLARLKLELVAMDELGAVLAGIMLSQTCHALEAEIEQLRDLAARE